MSKTSKKSKHLKMLLGGGITSCLLTTIIVAPLTIDHQQNKTILITNSQNKVLSYSPLTTESNNTIGTETTADTFFAGTDVSGVVYYTQDGQNITIVTGTAEQYETLNYVYGSDLTLKTNFDLGGQTGCNVVAIEDYGFYNDTDIRGSLDLSGDVKLTSIGDYCFEGVWFLTSVNLPDGITEISASCFGSCAHLQQVSLSNNLTKINSWAFNDDSMLASFPFASLTKLESIGESAFGGTSIESVFIANTVTSIGKNAFQYAPIKSISLGNTNASFTLLKTNEGMSNEGKILADNNCLVNDGGVLKWSDNSTVSGNLAYGHIYFPTDTTIATITQLASNSFEGCGGITGVELPTFTTCQTVGEQAFKECYDLSTVNIPNNIKSIDQNAFSSCVLKDIELVDGSQSFTKVTLGTGYAIISGTGSSWTDTTAPVGSLAIGDITIPEGITTIVSNAFHYAYGITSISLPSSITSVGEAGVEECQSLVNIDLSKCTKLNNIENAAFERNKNLQQITFCGSSNYKMINFKNGGAVVKYQTSATWTNTTQVVGGLAYGEIDLSDTDITTIAEDGFGQSEGVTSMIFPETLTSIPGKACSSCRYVQSYTYLNKDPTWLQYNEDYEVYLPLDIELMTIYLPDEDTISAYLDFISTNADTYESCAALAQSLNCGKIQFKTFTPSDGDNSNLGLILGLSLGLGIPVLAGAIIGIAVGVKKHHKNPKKNKK